MNNVFRHRISRLSLLITLLATLTNQHILALDSIDISDVKLEIVCKDTVRVNELVHIEYVLDYRNQFIPDSLELKIPEFETECAKLLYVHKSETCVYHNTINGKTKTTHKIKWDATIRAIEEGRFQTPNVSLLYQNNPIDISPKHKSVVVLENANMKKGNKHKKDTVIKLPDNAIIRLDAVLDKGSINLGDSVLLQVKLKFDQPISQVRFDKPIEIEDCFCEKIEAIANETIKTTVDGIECYECIISEYLIIPLKSGVIKIPKIKIKGECYIQKDEQDSFWDPQSKYYDVPFQAQSNEIKLKVKQP
jgi:hypothetical protein